MPETEQYWIDVYGKVVLTGEPVTYQNYARELGRYYDAFAFCPAPGRFAVVFTDVTEQVRAEDALRELARSGPRQAAAAEALAEASAALATALEPERLHEIILQQMARVVPCDTAHIFAYRDGWAVVAGGFGEPRLPAGTRVSRLAGEEGLFPQAAGPEHGC